MNKTNRQLTSFWEFIQNHRIIIPIIQRDYAQGRESEGPLRIRFLSRLKKALDEALNAREDGHSHNRLILDFVYGTPTSEGAIAPLDGQQRLTTLWLLHWYLAYVTGNLSNSVKNVLKSFSYETRVSSRDFCEKLCDLLPLDNENGSVRKHIENQAWFYYKWCQDPTISAMLTMLFGNDTTNANDSISAIFDRKDKIILKNYWELLTSTELSHTPIMFNHTIIGTEELPLSDDLYIKMNARGKPLSNFENFKAEVIKWVSAKISKEKAIEIASKFDNEWTDIFWEKGLGKQVHNVDELFFAFINRMYYQYIVTERSDGTFFFNEECSKVNNDYAYFSGNEFKTDKLISFQSLDPYTSRLREILDDLETIFENIKHIDTTALQPCWDKDFFFIPQYIFNKDNTPKYLSEVILDFSSINQQQRVVFYAISKYLLHPASNFDDQQSLSHWMRFVWNLISDKDSSGNDTIRSVSAIQQAITLIDMINNPRKVYSELYANSADLLKQLSKKNSVLEHRFIEEIEKINQILTSNPAIKHPSWADDWESAIIEAEKFRLFTGSIGVLFHNEKGEIDWTNFERKFANAKKYFAEPDSPGAIKQIIPYLSDEDILLLFDKYHLQYKDANVSHLLRTYQPRFHKYLMGECCSDTLTRLQSEIMALCEANPSFWIHKKWVGNKHVLSNYATKSGYFESNSYFLDTDYIESRYEFLETANAEATDLEIKIPREYTNPFKGLFIEFVCIYNDKKYRFRWTGVDWVDMYDNEGNLWRHGLHSKFNGLGHEPHFHDTSTFLVEVKRCITSYIDSIVNI